MKGHIYPTHLLPFLLAWFTVYAPVPADAQTRSASGTKYMISAPTPEAVDAGLAIFAEGGNAVTAAAAVAFAFYPDNSGYFGRVTPCSWTRSPTFSWEEAIPEIMGPRGAASALTAPPRS